MIELTALLLAAVTSQTSDSIFADAFDEPYVCPQSITTGTDTRTLRTISDVFYANTAHIRHHVILTEFDNIWGHITELDGLTFWPGVPGASPTIETLGKTQYVGAKFHVPANVLHSANGAFKHVMYSGGPDVDFSISRFCGDFESVEGCSASGAPPDDNPMVYWRIGQGNRYRCGLEPDTDYYVNIRFTDRGTTGPDCYGSTCYSTIQQYIGP